MSKIFSVAVIVLAILISGIIIMGRVVPSMISSSNTSEVILGVTASIVWIIATIGFVFAAVKKLFYGETNAPE